ncbi:MAG TPA: hypothetical protein VNY84_13535 [Acidimicrobiales bacterium]|nr:hypothetical protein [Acidimicrobiales bacterium]
MPWRRWGPYLAERAWGTVREDYSADGDAWRYFPHEHARSRAYRWSEDGLCGISDDHQFLCLALALWNGVDPILKERAFGLDGHEGNHGEDAKDYWWYLDSTPTHSWMRWRYFYPQVPFPYEQLRTENQRRTRQDPEYELVDTGVFDDGYWQVDVEVAKAGPEDVCIGIRATNRGPQAATLHVIPTLWWRNTWSWGWDDRRPWLRGRSPGEILGGGHTHVGARVLAGDGEPAVLFCDNDTNEARLWGSATSAPYPKDGIHDHIVSGTPTVNPAQTGTKAALWYRLSAEPSECAMVRLRLSPGSEAPDLAATWDATMAARAAEADAFYQSLMPAEMSADEHAVVRQALAGMLWSKQYYHFNVDHWLSGDPAQPAPPSDREQIRNAGWRHLNNADVISMPDTWEYPWYASWDLAFHCVALAHVDAEFAKSQLILLCREWYMHPNGQLPAYEWDFSDANPPVHAWAALRVWEIDGRRDYGFLERILHKLIINFTWWVNRKDEEGNNIFEGGFLGLDNIGPFDRSKVPPGDRLEQSDGTAWMAFYALGLLTLSLVLADHDETYEDLATKFFEHFAYIASAMDDQGLWDEADGFYYDVLERADGTRSPLRVRSMVGLIPLFAVTTLESSTLDHLAGFRARMDWFVANKGQYANGCIASMAHGEGERHLLAVVPPDRLVRLLECVLGEQEFLSPHGLRSLSCVHRDQPFRIDLGGVTSSVDYEPAESSTALFGGNSNWRGPVWFPLNLMIIDALARYHAFLGDAFTVEHPTGSGRRLSLVDVADDLARRLVSLFLDDGDGRRPVVGNVGRFQTDPTWHEVIPFYEYFHGDTGAGLGASHQTGWTGVVVDLLIGRSRLGPPTATGGAAG